MDFSISFRNKENCLSICAYEKKKWLDLECSSMKARQGNISEEKEKQGNPELFPYIHMHSAT